MTVEIRIVDLVEILPVYWAVLDPADLASRAARRLVLLTVVKPNPHRNAIQRHG